MSNVLILGSGYVGNILADNLVDLRGEVKVVSREMLNYHDTSVLRKYMLNNGIDVVINCSGFTGRPNIDEAETEKELCWNLNTVVPLAISNTCEDLNIDYIHISSGCIYTGYDKEFTEEDVPNFGLFDESSFYSKTKHAYESLSNYGCTIRVRMPFNDRLSPRSYLNKILRYNNLINFHNSKTYITDLTDFIFYLLNENRSINNIGILNFVNPEPLSTATVTDIMKEYGISNPHWRFVDMSEIDIVAPRSNCILSSAKLQSLYPNIKTETQAIHAALSNITQ